MDKISANAPDTAIINASEGIDIIKTHGEDNPHVWLDVKNAIYQLDTITEKLCELSPEHAEAFAENAAKYKEKLSALDEKIKKELDPVRGAKLVTFHEAFDYFAKAYGLDIAASIQRDEHTVPSPAELGEVIDIMNQAGIKALFLEPQYRDDVAETVAQATGAKVYTLDPIVSGEALPDEYIKAMEKNAKVLLTAFEN